MNYLDQIRKDVLSEGSDRIAEEVEDRIIFQSYITPNGYERIPLKDIIRNIGTEKDIQTIINHFKVWTVPSPQLFIYIACNLSQHLIDSNKDQQKTLDFTIRWTTTGVVKLCGGILFQDGKLSFHT